MASSKVSAPPDPSDPRLLSLSLVLLQDAGLGRPLTEQLERTVRTTGYCVATALSTALPTAKTATALAQDEAEEDFTVGANAGYFSDYRLRTRYEKPEEIPDPLQGRYFSGMDWRRGVTVSNVVFEPRIVGGAITSHRKKIAVQRGRAIAAIRRAIEHFECIAEHPGYGFVKEYIVEYESLIAELRTLDPDALPSRAKVEAFGGRLKTLSRVFADRIRRAGHGAPDHVRQRSKKATGHRDFGDAAQGNVAFRLNAGLFSRTNDS